MENVRFLAEKAKQVSGRLALLSGAAKNEILEKIAEALLGAAAKIVKENGKDIKAAKAKGLSEAMIDRLTLTEERVLAMAADIRKVMALPDPIGEILESRQQENGLFLKRVRVPLGVVCMIYEARPNVTVDAATLCIKSGNAVILRGASDILHSNKILIQLIHQVLTEVAVLAPESRLQDAVQLIDDTDRNAITELLKLHGLIDVVIPRGGAGLIQFVRENSQIPIIETGASVVHTYVDKDADIEKAVKILMNAKLRRISICNTLDSILLHEAIAQKALTALVKALPENPYKATRLELRGDTESYSLLQTVPLPANFDLKITRAEDRDYSTEFLDYVLAVKIVRNIDDAIEHISRHSLHHSEAIVTENRSTAEKFLAEVDAACVYWNASTQFSDGGQFGLGAEIGISTQKLHVRGPFALEGLTSYKWIIEGNGQIRLP